jgi:hypothetical protein
MVREIIYVHMPNESTDVWASADAEPLGGELYRVVDCRGEVLAFHAGAIVRCRKQNLSGDARLVAYDNVAEQE